MDQILTLMLPQRGSESAAMQLQPVPAGGFRMGDALTGPITTVTITREFWLGRNLVTQRQWQAVMGTNPSAFKFVGPDGPIDCVSWEDAIDFCRRVNGREHDAGRLP